ncbi:hypothetical protein MNB_SV-14-1109 [hydrothermal vent metagenome]|uniref:Uncharacterized protein n=1 Tax=hydrothermal vent metagenome TaxID=652676 RepID=A0A1W1BR53_9ZZZZ
MPSCPANGPSFTDMITESVGSSTCIGSSAIGFCISQIESPTSISEKPAIATISPASASAISYLSRPLKPISLETLDFVFSPEAFTKKYSLPFLTLPLKIRVIPIRPTKLSESSVNTCACVSASDEPIGYGTFSKIASKSGVISMFSSSISHLA